MTDMANVADDVSDDVVDVADVAVGRCDFLWRIRSLPT